KEENKEKLEVASLLWKKNNPDKVKQYQRTSNLRKNFGLSMDEYEEMLAKQNNLCAICEKPETFIHHQTKEPARLAVDHCHKTNKVRKLLCKSCNTALGLFKDDIGVM
ncbi:MAG: endonuclease VII domain-containing protein, partial [bacterium]